MQRSARSVSGTPRLHSWAALAWAALSLLAAVPLGCAQSHGALDDGGGRDHASGRMCTVASDCTLLPATCCGICGAATATDMVAVANEDVEANRAVACSAGEGCPECFMEQDPFLLAVCSEGACEARDLHADTLTACSTSDQCQLAPRVCCGCGLLGRAQVIAFNPAQGSYADLVCDPRADCPPCVPTFDGLSAECVAGLCEVVEDGAP